MKNAPKVILVTIAILVGLGYAGWKILVPRLIGRVVNNSVVSIMDTAVNQLDFSKAQIFNINQSLSKNGSMFLQMGINSGIINIDGNSTKDSLTGEIKYLGIKPTFSYETDKDKRALITVKSNDQSGEQENLHLSKQINGRIDIALGVGKINVDLRELNIPYLNIGAGVGSVDVTFSPIKSTKATLAAGAGKLTMSIPKGSAVRIAFGQGASFSDLKLGDLYEKVGNEYQTKGYDKAQIKTDITIGQALGGFSIKEY